MDELRTMQRRFMALRGMTGVFLVALAAGAHAGAPAPGNGAVLEFELTLEELSLTGGPFPIPLASDPNNVLGDSVDGYGFVNSAVSISLSSQNQADPGPATTGRARAFERGNEDALNTAGSTTPGPINPAELDGANFFVDSFFDVFFDITVTDVDSRPGRDFPQQPDGASMTLRSPGAAHLQSVHEAVFDKDAPNFGLIPPPEAAPYIGHFDIEIPLGGDINANGENDKIKFTLAVHSVGDEQRTFVILPDGTVLDMFDSAAFLDGAVVDESTDPPFTIGMLDPLTGLPDPTLFGGPTLATSRLVNPLLDVPEPVSLAMLAAGLLGAGVARRRRRA